MGKASIMAPLCTAWEVSVPNPFLPSPSQHHLPQIPLGPPSFWSPSPPSISPLSRSPQGWMEDPCKTCITYFGTISTRSTRETTGTLEALCTRRSTFTWETSFTL